MKTMRLVPLLLVLLCGRGIASDAQNEVILPSIFKSVEVAEAYIKTTSDGGEVHLLQPGKEDVLVVQFHADRKSDLAIVTYLFSDGAWQSVRMLGLKDRELHKLIVVDGEIVAVGLSTGRKITLFKAGGKRG